MGLSVFAAMAQQKLKKVSEEPMKFLDEFIEGDASAYLTMDAKNEPRLINGIKFCVTT